MRSYTKKLMVLLPIPLFSRLFQLSLPVPIRFEAGDKVYLKLEDGYTPPLNEIIPKKPAQHYLGRFTVLERVGRLASRFQDFPEESRSIQ